MNKKTIHDQNLADQRVLIRVDFNVPLDEDQVSDDTRITAAVPTIKAILAQKPRSVILMSHLGRPKGEVKPEFSLKPVVAVLAEKLGCDVAFAEDCIGDEVESAAASLPDGGVLLLENTRFHSEERNNDPDFAKKLASLGDVFVNDAFGTAHRAHASSAGITAYLPALAGLLMEKEITFLAKVIESPESPFVAILGGAKVSDKIDVIENLLGKADLILIGGGMANTFFKAQGIAVADSLVEKDAIATAKDLLSRSEGRLLLPVDVVIADNFSPDANHKTISITEGVPDGWRILDIGAGAVEAFSEHLNTAKTIIWNGPMGVFEFDNFAVGTFKLADAVVDATEAGAVTIIGGGDSAAAVRKAGLSDRVTHVSTGGGASLELLEGKILPGLNALNDK